MLSCCHDCFGLVEALYVQSFGRHRYDGRVGENFLCRFEPVYGRITGIGVCELCAEFCVRLIYADQFNIGILLHGDNFARGV